MAKYDYLIIYSNIIYILPVVVAFYKYFGQKDLQLDDLIVLTIGFCLLIIYSSFYHNCINEMNRRTEDGVWQQTQNDVIKKKKYPFQIIYECSDGDLPIPYNIAKLKDNLLGMFMPIFLSLIIVGVGEKTKFAVSLCSLFYMITILSYNKLRNIYLYVLPLGLMILFLIYHLIKSFDKYSLFEKICIGIAIIFIITAVILKFVMQEISENKREEAKKEANEDKEEEHKNNINLYHSLWHIFGGIGLALLLLPRIRKNQYKLFVN
jgi:predicted membrane channel-forming protein YqfA (hemolysin III family)